MAPAAPLSSDIPEHQPASPRVCPMCGRDRQAPCRVAKQEADAQRNDQNGLPDHLERTHIPGDLGDVNDRHQQQNGQKCGLRSEHGGAGHRRGE